MRMFTEVGRRVGAHSTGVGNALLSLLPDEEIRALVARTGMSEVTPNTITDVERLLSQITRIRRDGRGRQAGTQARRAVRCRTGACRGVAVCDVGVGTGDPDDLRWRRGSDAMPGRRVRRPPRCVPSMRRPRPPPNPARCSARKSGPPETKEVLVKAAPRRVSVRFSSSARPKMIAATPASMSPPFLP